MEAMEHPSIFEIPNFIPWVSGPTVPEHVAMAWFIMLVLAVTSFLITRRLDLVPGGAQNFLEFVIELFYDLLDNMVGPKGRRYLPLIGTAGLFILISNLLGLIPGFKSPTSNLNTTVALALTVFFSYHYFGIKEQGLIPYFRHFFGPLAQLPRGLLFTMGPILALIFFIVESISHAARPVSLSIRLFGNIFGEDTVLLILFFLAPLIVPLPMMFLAIFTSVVQAFIFIMLSMVYIAGAVEIAHEEH